MPLYFYTNVTSQNSFTYFIASYTNVSNSAVSIVAAYNDTCVEIYTRGQVGATSDPQIQQTFMLQVRVRLLIFRPVRQLTFPTVGGDC
jgi:hypothetical protein